MAAYDIPTAVHRAVLAGTDRIPTPRAQEGEVSTADARTHTAECYAHGCTTGSHPAPRPGHVTGGPWTPEELTADLSSAERSVVDRIEQAPDAPEALRERVAEAIHDGDGSRCRHGWLDCPRAPVCRRMADAAITAMRGAR